MWTFKRSTCTRRPTKCPRIGYNRELARKSRATKWLYSTSAENGSCHRHCGQGPDWFSDISEPLPGMTAPQTLCAFCVGWQRTLVLALDDMQAMVYSLRARGFTLVFCWVPPQGSSATLATDVDEAMARSSTLVSLVLTADAGARREAPVTRPLPGNTERSRLWPGSRPSCPFRRALVILGRRYVNLTSYTLRLCDAESHWQNYCHGKPDGWNLLKAAAEAHHKAIGSIPIPGA